MTVLESATDIAHTGPPIQRHQLNTLHRPIGHGSQEYLTLFGMLDQIRAHFRGNHGADTGLRFIQSGPARQSSDLPA
jgi:hypothetical protein